MVGYVTGFRRVETWETRVKEGEIRVGQTLEHLSHCSVETCRENGLIHGQEDQGEEMKQIMTRCTRVAETFSVSRLFSPQQIRSFHRLKSLTSNASNFERVRPSFGQFNSTSPIVTPSVLGPSGFSR